MDFRTTLDPAPFLAGVRAMQGALSGLLGAIGPLAALAGAFAGVRSAVGLAGKGLGLAMDAEDLEVSFRVMLGSAEAAKSVMEDLYAFSDESPFESEKIVAAGKQLLAFGFSAASIKPILKDAGDLAAGMGKDIDQVADVMGRMKAGDFGQAFQTLRGMGISSKDLEGAGLKFDQGGSYVGSAEAAIEGVRQIIRKKFGGTMAELANTTRSQFLGLQERIGDILRAAFEPVSQVVGPLIGEIAALASGMVEPARKFGEYISKGIALILNAFKRGELGELLGVALEAGFIKSVNALMRGIQGAAAFLLSVFQTAGERLLVAFKALTTPSYWQGFKQVLSSVANGFVAVLATALAPVVNKLISVLNKIPGVNIDFDAAGMAKIAKDAASEGFSEGLALMGTAMQPLVDRSKRDLTTAIAEAKSAMEGSVDLFDATESIANLQALIQQLKPEAIASTPHEETADNASADPNSLVASASKGTKSAADAYARIGLFVGGGAAADTETRRTQQIVTGIQKTVETKLDKLIQVMQDRPLLGAWA